MNWFNFDLRKAAIWLLAAILPFISINVQERSRSQQWLDQPFSLLAGGIQNGFFSFSDGVRGTTAMYLNLIDLKKKSHDVMAENALLKTRLQQMEELRKENTRLLGLLDFQSKSKMQLFGARVIAHDLLSDHATIRIDKGTHHGLKAGQAVISTDGVVGTVFRPSAFTSQVLLITDRYSVIDGLVARSRARGIAEGKGPHTLAFRYVEKSEDIKKGDLIVTSGIDNIFPKGFPVAEVSEVESKRFAASLKVELKPVVDPSQIEEVFVIQDAANQDYSEKVATEHVQK